MQIIQENELLIKLYNKNLKENDDEIMTDNYISNKAELIITVLEAMNLQLSGHSVNISPYVNIIVEDKLKNSYVKENTLNPVWNENFIL